MVLISRASVADFTFFPSEYSGEVRVLGFNGIEEISGLFNYRLRLASLDSEIDFGTIIGKTAYLRIAHESGERYVNGIVSRFTQTGLITGTTNRYNLYLAELVPIELLLSMQHDSRIFQGKNVQEIITDVLSNDINLQSDQYRFSLNDNHPTREFCVQYRESGLNFISRLMEDEGIFYFFEHDDEKHVMVIADNSSANVAIDSPNIPFNPSSGMVTDQEFIYSFRFTQQIRPNIAVLRDFDYNDPFPRVNLVGLDAGTDYISTWFTDQELEFYDYPGGFMDRDRGDELAQIRLQSFRQNVQVGAGSSACRRLIPGYKFTLEGHSRSDFNQEYLITRVETSATQPLGEGSNEGLKYNNNFECVPSSIVYRPIRKTPKPMVEGVQTAIVVGPSGSDIYTDDLGRVKVEFHWDRNESEAGENRSCWVRVSNGYAGEKHGMQFTPLIGDEVIVDFLEGDPDRPIITGRVYNAVNYPHLNSDDTIQNLILTPYHHRLIFDDKKRHITLNTGGGQNLTMTDGSREDLNNISLQTSGRHTMTMSDGAQKIEIKTTGGHELGMNDSSTRVYLQTSGGHLFGMTDQEKFVLIDTSGGNRLLLNDAEKIIQMNTPSTHRITLSDQNNYIHLKTAGGHEVMLDDALGYIEIDSKGRHSIKIDDTEQCISITSNLGHKIAICDASGEIYFLDSSTSLCLGIFASEGKIILRSDTGNVNTTARAGTITIEGMNIEIKATGSLKLSGATAELKGNTSTQIKGGTIQMGPPT